MRWSRGPEQQEPDFLVRVSVAGRLVVRDVTVGDGVEADRSPGDRP
jgi:hypothetical protein